MNITIDDLKRLSEIYDAIIDRADELLNMQSEINGKSLYIESIYELNNETIGFICEDKYNDTSYKYFTFEEFLSEDYLNKYKKQYEQHLEEQRIKKEKEDKERLSRIEKQEIETLKMLKEKYPEQ